jgi:hypothetical protein
MRTRFLTAVGLAIALALPLGVSAGNPASAATHVHSRNMHPLGDSPRPNPAPGVFNSDLTFWGGRAYQGTYDGFRIIDISSPGNPKALNDYDECLGNQGDVIIWDTILIRSWNSPAPVGATCDGQPVPQGWEGSTSST